MDSFKIENSDVKRIAGALVGFAASCGMAMAAPDVGLLYDGKMNPACVWEVSFGTNGVMRPIEVVTDFGEMRTVGGVRMLSPRSWVNCSVKKASFYIASSTSTPTTAPTTYTFLGTFDFRPANTYKESFATWKPVACRGVKMVIEDTWDFKREYYGGYTAEATPELPRVLGAPLYPRHSGPKPTVQIAELAYFGAEVPKDLPLPNPDGSVAYPESRLVRDWMFQSCAVSNVSHCASVEPDTTKPDPLGEDISSVETNAAWFAERAAKRRAFLAEFRAICDEFVYVKHLVMGNSIIHATDDLTDASWQEWQHVPDYRGGSQLVRATILPDGSVRQRVLVDEPVGVIRDPQLSPDGRKLVFAKRRNLERDDYHLWTYDLETDELRQLTRNPIVPKEAIGRGQTNDFEVICSDIEPCWLPDGSILFQSTRCCHSVDCWPLPVSNLHRCDADGRNIRRIGFDQVQTFFPQLLNDGRVVFTRWEYNDRETAFLEKPVSMNPDGSHVQGFFLNNSEYPGGIFHIRPMPDCDNLLAIATGHHVAQKGKVVELDPSLADDYADSTYDASQALYGINTNAIVYTFNYGIRKTIVDSPWDGKFGMRVATVAGMWNVAGSAMDVTPGRSPMKTPRDFHFNVYDMAQQFGPQWAYPCPLDRTHFLTSFMPEGCRFYRGPYSSRFGVYAQTVDGRRELLAFDWGNHCMQPIPLKARKVTRRLVAKPDCSDGFGSCYIQDVYAGEAAKGLRRGEVKKVRVVAMELRPVHIGWNWQYGWHSSQGKIGTPISVGNGAYDVKHVFGEADVEADGSCSFRVPARTPVFFQYVNGDGLVLQTMRSWTTLVPGESASCVGCHERPQQAAFPRATIASRRPPQELKPYVEGAAEHPYLAKLKSEGPLASLDNWMGVNRPKRMDPTDCGDGFSFAREIQPILDRSCVACHSGVAGRPDLRAQPAKLPQSDVWSKRRFSCAYLDLSRRGACDDKINFSHALAFAPFKPPKTFGAIRSAWYQMLAKGHPDAGGKKRVTLPDADLRRIACWIDLCVPFCGSYVEAHDWADWYQQRFNYTASKRSACAWEELNEVRAERGLKPVPLTGFVPNIVNSRRQVRWDE